MYSYISNDEKDTMLFAQKIASKLTIGDIVVLSGELGSGKTKFAEGFLKCFKLDSEVSSPTFTIVNEHNTTIDGKNIIIYHFDLYRLSDIDEFYAIGGEEYFTKGICLIEWGELIEPILPTNYLKISFTRDDINENKRILTLHPFGEKFTNLIVQLQED